jgi:hypothetical protein
VPVLLRFPLQLDSAPLAGPLHRLGPVLQGQPLQPGALQPRPALVAALVQEQLQEDLWKPMTLEVPGTTRNPIHFQLLRVSRLQKYHED